MTCEISDVTMSTICVNLICTNSIICMLFNTHRTYTCLWHMLCLNLRGHCGHYHSKIAERKTFYRVWWIKLALTSPFSNLSIHLKIGGSVVTFCHTKAFWITFTKIINSPGVPGSNIGILILYFPEVELLGVLWQIWSVYLFGLIFSILNFLEESLDWPILEGISWSSILSFVFISQSVEK